MTTALGLIAPEISAALEEVEVAEGGLSAVVAGEDVEGTTPGDLAKKLGGLFYQNLHAGMADQGDTTRQRSLRDDDFDQRLFAAMPHRTTRVQATVVSDDPEADSVIVRLDGLRVRIPRDRIADRLPGEDSDLVTLHIPAPRPALSTGFFLTDGSRGRVTGSQMLRLYIHLTDAESAPDAWRTVLSRMEELELRYRAKVTSSLKHFPRRDALVVYLGADAWHVAGDIAASVQGLPGLGSATSPFVRRVADGVGAAWEPDDPRPGKGKLSFGEHRCQVLAEALVGHAVRADGVAREAVVAEAYLNAGTDPLMPARNLDSPVLPGIGLA
ncbi:T3SS effector HopA1 family protein [Streptomyces sp. NPDC096176]|uniref:T3SS effector HopA1 family protein n=1 Tax=Streptomyces sp. NPDC096176 TaxID=3366079 RepID=UPI003822C197